MKKIILIVLCLALALPAASFGEENLFETLSGLEWSFNSGAGGWSTDMRIGSDGSFTGEYHDSEMGESTEDYPDGILYFCSFSGRMSVAEQVDSNTWKIKVDKLEEDPGMEEIRDGIRYVPAHVYGLSEGNEMLLYRPGTPVSVLSEDMQFWAHVIDQENPPTELEDWFMCNEKNGSGFVGYPAAAVANPWEDLSAEALKEATGVTFGVPEGAENVIYRYLPGENLAEMQFSWSGGSFCARSKPAADGKDLPDISGMYYPWEHEEDVTIGQGKGSIALARETDGTWAERCLWYDPAAGRVNSLSVIAPDADGLDLAALAEQVFYP